MKYQMSKNAAWDELNDIFVRMITYVNKIILFDFGKFFNHLKKKCVQFTKLCQSIPKNAFNSLKVVI